MKNMTNTNLCPCGSTLDYSKCCEPFHLKKAKAQTAEQLMRARYSAYVKAHINFIEETNDSNSEEPFDSKAAETWAKESKWLGLQVLRTEKGQAADNEGLVEFKANYIAEGKNVLHHEISTFRKDPSKGWLFVEGKQLMTPERRAEPKTGRNDPCPCGSGKKFKKCCGSVTP